MRRTSSLIGPCLFAFTFLLGPAHAQVTGCSNQKCQFNSQIVCYQCNYAGGFNCRIGDPCTSCTEAVCQGSGGGGGGDPNSVPGDTSLDQLSSREGLAEICWQRSAPAAVAADQPAPGTIQVSQIMAAGSPLVLTEVTHKLYPFAAGKLRNVSQDAVASFQIGLLIVRRSAQTEVQLATPVEPRKAIKPGEEIAVEDQRFSDRYLKEPAVSRLLVFIYQVRFQDGGLWTADLSDLRAPFEKSR